MKNQNLVLIVDDEEPIRRLIKARMEREGYEVETAENAEEGYRKWKALHPAVLITDIKMPGRDGLSLLSSVRAHDPYAKVVVMTGHGEKSTAIQSLKAGAIDYMEKPFDLEELVHSVERYAKKKVDLPTNVIPLFQSSPQNVPQKKGYTDLKKEAMDAFEVEYLKDILTRHHGNVSQASKEAGIDRSNFLRLLRRHKISAAGFRKSEDQTGGSQAA